MQDFLSDFDDFMCLFGESESRIELWDRAMVRRTLRY